MIENHVQPVVVNNVDISFFVEKSYTFGSRSIKNLYLSISHDVEYLALPHGCECREWRAHQHRPGDGLALHQIVGGVEHAARLAGAHGVEHERALALGQHRRSRALDVPGLAAAPVVAGQDRRRHGQAHVAGHLALGLAVRHDHKSLTTHRDLAGVRHDRLQPRSFRGPGKNDILQVLSDVHDILSVVLMS
jgi:hypothetical protein